MTLQDVIQQAAEIIRAVDGERSDLLPLHIEEEVLYFGETGLWVAVTGCTKTTLGHPIRTTGFDVGWEEYYPGTYENPPEIDIHEGPTFDGLRLALEWVLTEYHRRRIQAYFEIKDEEALAEEMLQGEWE